MVVTAMVTFQDARKWVCAGSAVCRLPWESALCAPGRDGPLWPGGSEAALSWSAEERGLWSHSRCRKHLKVRPYLEHVQKRSFYASVCTCSPAPHVSGPPLCSDVQRPAWLRSLRLRCSRFPSPLLVASSVRGRFPSSVSPSATGWASRFAPATSLRSQADAWVSSAGLPHGADASWEASSRSGCRGESCPASVHSNLKTLNIFRVHRKWIREARCDTFSKQQRTSASYWESRPVLENRHFRWLRKGNRLLSFLKVAGL